MCELADGTREGLLGGSDIVPVHRLGTRVAESAESEVNHAVSGSECDAGTGTSGAHRGREDRSRPRTNAEHETDRWSYGGTGACTTESKLTLISHRYFRDGGKEADTSERLPAHLLANVKLGMSATPQRRPSSSWQRKRSRRTDEQLRADDDAGSAGQHRRPAGWVADGSGSSRDESADRAPATRLMG